MSMQMTHAQLTNAQAVPSELQEYRTREGFSAFDVHRIFQDSILSRNASEIRD